MKFSVPLLYQSCTNRTPKHRCFWRFIAQQWSWKWVRSNDLKRFITFRPGMLEQSPRWSPSTSDLRENKRQVEIIYRWISCKSCVIPVLTSIWQQNPEESRPVMKRDGFQTKRTRLEQSCKSTSWNHPRGALFVCSCGRLLSDSHKKRRIRLWKTTTSPSNP